MRWFWIDRFDEFVRGTRAVSTKNVTLAEEPLDEYFPGLPHYPHSLIIEGMAQTGGLLLSEASGFTKKVVLAKVGRATFHRFVLPGDQLKIVVELKDTQSAGAIAEGKAYIGDTLQAEVELWFAILGSGFGEQPHLPPESPFPPRPGRYRILGRFSRTGPEGPYSFLLWIRFKLIL